MSYPSTLFGRLCLPPAQGSLRVSVSEVTKWQAGMCARAQHGGHPSPRPTWLLPLLLGA